MNARSEYTDGEFAEKAAEAFANKDCGDVFRVKGFVRDGDGWLECNAMRSRTDIRPIDCGQDIVIVIGEKLNSNIISAIFDRKA